MAELTKERELLLEKLFNLCRDESIITTGIQSEIDSLTDEKKETEKSKLDEEKKQEELNLKLDTFTRQADIFLDKFSTFDNSSFESLREIGIELNIGTLLSELRDSMPTHKGEISSQIAETQQNIVIKDEDISRLNVALYEARKRLESAESTKGKANALLNDILNNNNNSYNRDYVHNVLSEFDIFTEDDKLILEFLILFPENGLRDFAESYDSKEHNNPFIENIVEEEPEIINEEVEEITEEVSIPEPELSIPENPIEFVPEEQEIAEEVEEIVSESELVTLNEPIITEESEYVPLTQEPIPTFEPILEEQYFAEPIIPVVESTINIEEPTVEEEAQQEEIIEEVDTFAPTKDLLANIGYDINKVSEEKLESILKLTSNESKELLESNLKLLNELSVPEEVIYDVKDNYMYITDKDLNRKIEILKSRNISLETLRNELTQWNFTTPLNVFADRIEALDTIGETLTDQNVNKLKNDLIGFYESVLKLAEVGMELDDKEIRNNEAVLTNNEYVKESADVLQKYSIKLVRKNGKYALEVFWKNPKELTSTIEQLQEANLSRLIETNPEILSKNTDTVLKRVKFCEEKNIPLTDENGKYLKYVYDEVDFGKNFKNVELPNIIDTALTNEYIPEIVGNSDYVKLLVEGLNRYYENNELLDEISFNNSELETKYNQMITGIPNSLNATLVADSIYSVGDTLISKTKLERNIAIIISMLSQQNEAIDGLEREIILTSAMHQLHATPDELRKVAENCLGFNAAPKRMGGMAA